MSVIEARTTIWKSIKIWDPREFPEPQDLAKSLAANASGVSQIVHYFLGDPLGNLPREELRVEVYSLVCDYGSSPIWPRSTAGTVNFEGWVNNGYYPLPPCGTLYLVRGKCQKIGHYWYTVQLEISDQTDVLV